MGIVIKYIANNTREHKMRTVVMLLSMMLSTTLLFVSLSIGESYAAAQRKMARGMAGAATLSVSLAAPSEGPRRLTLESIPKGPAIENAVGVLRVAGLYKEEGYYENVDIIAADLDALSAINKPRLLEGGELNAFEGNQVVLPDRFTTKFGVEQGDTVTLWINGSPHPFQVAAIAAYDTVFLRHTRGTNALIPLDALSDISGTEGGYSEILLVPQAGVTTADLEASLKATLPRGYRVATVINERQVDASAREKSMPFYLISFFSLTMSLFIIYSSYKVITLERLPIIGTFRSIGATAKHVTQILLLESLGYGVTGALLGIPLGLLVLHFLLRGLGNALSQGIAIPMVVLPWHMMLACLVTALASALSAWLPIKRASKLPIKAVILGTVADKELPPSKASLMGILFMVIALMLPYLGQLVGGNGQLLAGGLSLVGLLAATIVVIPTLGSGVAAVMEKVYGALLGSEGWLAARHIRGNRHMAQNITLLFISISAIIAITVVGDFAQVYIGDVFRGAKLDGFSDATMSPGFMAQIKKLEGIHEVLPVRVMANTIALEGTVLNRVEGTDDIQLYGKMFALTFGKTEDPGPTREAFNGGRNILLSRDCMGKLGVKVGEVIELTTQEGGTLYTVMGSYSARATQTDGIIPDRFARSDFDTRHFGLVAYTAPNPEAVMVQIRDLFGDTSHWSRTVAEFNADALGTIQAFFAPMQKLTWFILALATVGIMNNLLINHIQRQRTTAMYRSVGMSKRQHMVIILLENLTTGVIGVAVAMVVSWLEIRTIFMVAGPRLTMQPQLNLGTFLLSGALGIGITLLGAMAPLWRSQDIQLVKALKCD